MPVLKMQGRPITNFCLFRELFEPCALLRQRELAADFAVGHLMLEDEMRFYVSALCAAVRGRRTRLADAWSEHNEGLDYPENMTAQDYFDDVLALAPRGVELEEEQIKKALPVAQAVFALCGGAVEDEALRARLSVLLTSAYLLAGADLSTHPLDGQAVLDGWARRMPQQGKRGPRVECVLPADSTERIPTVVLAPDPEPYVCPRFTGVFDPEKHRIRTYRIEADSRSSFGHDAAVVLEVCGERVRIERGGHVYVNAVAGGAVCLLPDCVRSGAVCVERESDGQDDSLLVTYNDTQRTLRFEPGVRVTSFATGGQPDSLLFIRDGRLSIDSFAAHGNYVKLQILQERRVVQVGMRGNEYIVLQDNGRVHSSLAKFNGRTGVLSLDELGGA